MYKISAVRVLGVVKIRLWVALLGLWIGLLQDLFGLLDNLTTGLSGIGGSVQDMGVPEVFKGSYTPMVFKNVIPLVPFFENLDCEYLFGLLENLITAPSVIGGSVQRIVLSTQFGILAKEHQSSESSVLTSVHVSPSTPLETVQVLKIYYFMKNEKFY